MPRTSRTGAISSAKGVLSFTVPTAGRVADSCLTQSWTHTPANKRTAGSTLRSDAPAITPGTGAAIRTGRQAGISFRLRRSSDPGRASRRHCHPFPGRHPAVGSQSHPVHQPRCGELPDQPALPGRLDFAFIKYPQPPRSCEPWARGNGRLRLQAGADVVLLARARIWWNWQTRYFEVVVPKGVQVQVLLSAPLLDYQ